MQYSVELILWDADIFSNMLRQGSIMHTILFCSVYRQDQFPAKILIGVSFAYWQGKVLLNGDCMCYSKRAAPLSSRELISYSILFLVPGAGGELLVMIICLFKPQNKKQAGAYTLLLYLFVKYLLQGCHINYKTGNVHRLCSIFRTME